MFDNNSKINGISPTYIKKLGLHIQKTNVGAQKIEGSALKIFGMIIADFQVKDKGGKPRFFQETVLVTNIKFEVILRMLFLKISNANMAFDEGTLTWMSYTTNKVLPTTKQVQLVDPKKFVIVALNVDSETFVVAIGEREKMPMHLKRRAQIQDKAQVGALLFNEAPTEVPAKYSNYSDVFWAENTIEHPENTRMNEHAIELEEDI